MPKRMEFSNRSSHRKGKSISIYLRGEDLETLDRLAKAFNNDRSKTIQFMLTTVKGWLDGILEEKPEFIMGLIREEMLSLYRNLDKRKNL